MENGEYTRLSSDARRRLSSALLKYYNCDEKEYTCFVFPSGMSAISTILTVFASKERRFLIGEELYCDTPKVCEHLLSSDFIKGYDYVSTYDETAPYGLAFLEACSNPHGIFPNYEALKKMKEKNDGMVLVIDNTWLSGCSFNPFQHGADIILESMSKYLSNSKCIAGMVITKNIHADRLFKFMRTYGLHVSSDTCEKILTTLETVERRIAGSSANTHQVLSQIDNTNIVYPKDISMKYSPSIFVLYVPLPSKHFPNARKFNQMKDVLKELVAKHSLHYETSFGSAYHRIDCYPKIANRTDPALREQKCFRIRIYVGYEQPIEDLLNFIKEVTQEVSP